MPLSTAVEDVDLDGMDSLTEEEVEGREVFQAEQAAESQGPLLDFFLGGGRLQIEISPAGLYSSL